MKNSFLIPCGMYWGLPADACSLFWSPLTKKAIIVDKEFASRIATNTNDKRLLDTDCDIETCLDGRYKNNDVFKSPCPLNIQVLLNEKCNFSCSYCYSAGSRCGAEMDEKVLWKAIEWMHKCAAEQKKDCIGLTFVGGGEPMLSWPMIVGGIEHSENLQSKDGVAVKSKIVTNGSVVTSEQLEYIKKKKMVIQVSFEIIKEVQNHQRGQFAKVHENLCRLGEKGVDTRIRSTITEVNVDRMAEMVAIVVERYPFIKKLAFEPVVDSISFDTAEKMRSFAGRYFEELVRAKDVARSNGIDLSSSLSRTWRNVKNHFCGPIYSLSPDGSLTGCSHYSSYKIPGYECFRYGQITSESICVDNDKFNQLFSGNDMELCNNCWLKFNCAGGCPNHKTVYPKEVFDEICRLRREVCLYELLHTLADNYATVKHCDFWSDISRRLRCVQK